jgi:hypothetical protein
MAGVDKDLSHTMKNREKFQENPAGETLLT